MPATATKWLTPPEIAEAMGVGASTVIGWIRSGELAALDVARRDSRRPRYRIAEADFEAWKEGRRVRPPAPKARRRRSDPSITQYF